MDIEEITGILSEGTLNDKIYMLCNLSNVFESYNKNINHFEEILEFLIHLAIKTKDEKVKEEILETICTATIYQNIDKINFDTLEQDIQRVSVKFLPRYIDILSYTNNKKYVKSILGLKNHPDRYVRIAVEEAIKEMGIE